MATSVHERQGDDFLTAEAARRMAGIGDRRTLPLVGIEADAWLIPSEGGKKTARKPLYRVSTLEAFIAAREVADCDGTR